MSKKPPERRLTNAEPEWEDWQLEAIRHMPALEEVWRAVRDALVDNDLPPLSEKQRERIEAYELRAELRREQGRST